MGHRESSFSATNARSSPQPLAQHTRMRPPHSGFVQVGFSSVIQSRRITISEFRNRLETSPCRTAGERRPDTSGRWVQKKTKSVFPCAIVERRKTRVGWFTAPRMVGSRLLSLRSDRVGFIGCYVTPSQNRWRHCVSSIFVLPLIAQDRSSPPRRTHRCRATVATEDFAPGSAG